MYGDGSDVGLLGKDGQTISKLEQVSLVMNFDFRHLVFFFYI